MEVILLKDLKRRGTFGDIIEVNNGYARNYLIPFGFALAANNANKKRFEEIKQKELAKVTELRKTLTETANSVSGKTFKMTSLSRDGKLYGSITTATIANQIKEEIPDLNINGSDILIEEGHIKYVGTYTCKVQFTKDIFSSFTMIIEADESDEQPELLEAILEGEEADISESEQAEDVNASDESEVATSVDASDAEAVSDESEDETSEVTDSNESEDTTSVDASDAEAVSDGFETSDSGSEDTTSVDASDAEAVSDTNSDTNSGESDADASNDNA